MSKVWPALEGASNVRRWVVDRHVQANFKGSDRYTLSQPGSIAESHLTARPYLRERDHCR